MAKATPETQAAPLNAEQLIRKHQAGVWRYLRSLGCDRSLADDLTQDTFVSALSSGFEQLSEKATAAYLRRIGYNALVDLKRRSGKVVAVEDVEIFDQAWEATVTDDSGDELITIMKGCLKKLTDRARRSLEMRFSDKCSRTEIAEALNISEHGAKNLMQRAKKQLRACVEKRIDS